MDQLPINTKTDEDVQSYLNRPGQSVGLIGEKWLNKGRLARSLAEQLLGLNAGELANYPYVLTVKEDEKGSISIDQVRAINDFTLLRVPTKHAISRVVVIENAQKMKPEAQNALLKKLEEPPAGTIFILTAESTASLLPTISSRLKLVKVSKPTKADLESYYLSQGYKPPDVAQALLISDRLPGLMELLLSEEDNPIRQAMVVARQLLSSTRFERIALINNLYKDKESLKNLFFVLKQMAKISLNTADTKSSQRWQKILSATLVSEAKLKANSQAKLLLTAFMLSLG